MIKRIKLLWLDEDFFKPTGIIFSASALVNVLNFLYYFVMVRILDVKDYGLLASLVGIFTIISLPVGVVQTVVARFTAEFNAKFEFEKVKSIFWFFFNRILVFSIVFLAAFVLLGSSVSAYLKIDDSRIPLILGGLFFLSFFQPLVLGCLQGLNKFLGLAVNSIVNTLSKFILGIFLVNLGFGVRGALLGFGASFLVSSLLGLKQLPKEMFAPAVKTNIGLKGIFEFFLPTVIGLFCFASLIGMDVPLVRHFFSVDDTGLYSIAQLVGKIMFFLPSALMIVMFSKVASFHTQGKNTLRLLKKNLFFAAFLLGILGLFIYIFPSFSLKVLARSTNPAGIHLARLFVIAMFFYSLVNILMTYFLSIKKFEFIYVLAVGTLAQFVLINILHNSLEGILYILCGVSIVLFISGLFILRKDA